MSDLQRLLDGFDAGELIRPFAGSTSLVDVIRASAAVCGVDDLPMNDASRAIAADLAGAEHLVFVLADGLGVQFIDMLRHDSWLRSYPRRTIQATFPLRPRWHSPRSPPVTTRAPTQSPDGGRISPLGAAVTVFHNSRSIDDVSLDDLGVDFRELCPRTLLLPRMQRDLALVTPANIVNSPFTRYMSGGAPCIAYGRHAEAAYTIADRIAQASGPTFTYWYTPYPDSLAHEHGTVDPRVLTSIEDFDAAIGKLITELRRHDIAARIVVTADHGHLDVGGAGHLEVTADDPLLAYLLFPLG